MYGAKRYLLNANFGNSTSPNRRTSSNDDWAMTDDWGNTGGGWFPGSFSGPLNISINSGEFVAKNNELEQNILP